MLLEDYNELTRILSKSIAADLKVINRESRYPSPDSDMSDEIISSLEKRVGEYRNIRTQIERLYSDMPQ